MAKFDLFKIFKHKQKSDSQKEQPQKKDVPIEEMSFDELLQKFDELNNKIGVARYANIEEEKLAEFSRQYDFVVLRIKKMIHEEKLPEAVDYAKNLTSEYIELYQRKKLLKEKEEKLEEIEGRYNTLKIKKHMPEIDDGKPFSDEDEKELAVLESKIKEIEQKLKLIREELEEIDSKLRSDRFKIDQFEIENEEIESMEKVDSEAELKKFIEENLKDDSLESKGNQPGNE